MWPSLYLTDSGCIPKMVWSLLEASEIAKILYSEFICRYGAPDTIVTDCGQNFMSTLIREMCKMFQITKVETSAYHPQSNATCERMNSVIEQSLRSYCKKKSFRLVCIQDNTIPSYKVFSILFVIWPWMQIAHWHSINTKEDPHSNTSGVHSTVDIRKWNSSPNCTRQHSETSTKLQEGTRQKHKSAILFHWRQCMALLSEDWTWFYHQNYAGNGLAHTT